MPQFHYSYWLAPLLIALILFAVSLLIRVRALQAIYREKFPETPRERLFWAALGFFVAVAVVRILTFLIHNEIGPFHDIQMRARHIHHLVWGILLLLVTGYGWLLRAGTGDTGSRTWVGRVMSMASGLGRPSPSMNLHSGSTCATSTGSAKAALASRRSHFLPPLLRLPPWAEPSSALRHAS